jgi:polysaccharide biosynthesis/export protein
MFRTLGILLVLSWGQFPSISRAQAAPPDELIQYVRDARKAGLNAEQITKNALAAGWMKAIVEQAVELAEKPKTAAAEPVKVAKAEPEREAPKTPAVSSPSLENKPDAAPAANAPARSTAPAVAPAAGVDRTLRDTYQVGEGDVLQISVWGEPAASVPSGVVRPDGMISMPLIKDIRVAGLTPSEAEKAITEQLSKQIKSADVTVIVGQINSKKVFVVGGGVKKEGPISFTYRMTVMQALSEAGGLTDYAKRKKIYVLRNENGRQYKLPFDYDAVLRGERTELNIPLQAGDTLVVPNH